MFAKCIAIKDVFNAQAVLCNMNSKWISRNLFAAVLISAMMT